jgi:hypothetical protein
MQHKAVRYKNDKKIVFILRKNIADLATVAGAYPVVLDGVLSTDHVFENLRGTDYESKQTLLRRDCK